jgi:hypothetical protein
MEKGKTPCNLGKGAQPKVLAGSVPNLGSYDTRGGSDVSACMRDQNSSPPPSGSALRMGGLAAH